MTGAAAFALLVLAGFFVGGAISMYRQRRVAVACLLGAAGVLSGVAGALRL